MRKHLSSLLGHNLNGLRQLLHESLPIDQLPGGLLDLLRRSAPQHVRVVCSAKGGFTGIDGHLKHQLPLP